MSPLGWPAGLLNAHWGLSVWERRWGGERRGQHWPPMKELDRCVYGSLPAWPTYQTHTCTLDNAYLIIHLIHIKFKQVKLLIDKKPPLPQHWWKGSDIGGLIEGSWYMLHLGYLFALLSVIVYMRISTYQFTDMLYLSIMFRCCIVLTNHLPLPELEITHRSHRAHKQYLITLECMNSRQQATSYWHFNSECEWVFAQHPPRTCGLRVIKTSPFFKHWQHQNKQS